MEEPHVCWKHGGGVLLSSSWTRLWEVDCANRNWKAEMGEALLQNSDTKSSPMQGAHTELQASVRTSRKYSLLFCMNNSGVYEKPVFIFTPGPQCACSPGSCKLKIDVIPKRLNCPESESQKRCSLQCYQRSRKMWLMMIIFQQISTAIIITLTCSMICCWWIIWSDGRAAARMSGVTQLQWRPAKAPVPFCRR